MWRSAVATAGVAATFALLSGCVSSPQESDVSPAGSSIPEPRPPPEGNATPPVENVTIPSPPTMILLYEFRGTVSGSSPPDPQGTGPATDGPPALAEPFVVPAGVRFLTFNGSVDDGAGLGRIEIYDSGDSLVYASDLTLSVGAPGRGILLVRDGTETIAQAPYASGEYEVRFYVAGALGVRLAVTGA